MLWRPMSLGVDADSLSGVGTTCVEMLDEVAVHAIFGALLLAAVVVANGNGHGAED